jgi:hypothetical protein
VPARALTDETLGAWVVKVDPSRRQGDVDDVLTGASAWCVRPTYRTGLVTAGEPVLLWLSGGDAGFHAQGRTTGPAYDDGGRRAVPVEVRPLDPLVLRTALRAHPVLAGIEVLTMPAGSNPSYLSREQLRALRDGWSQVTVDR